MNLDRTTSATSFAILRAGLLASSILAGLAGTAQAGTLPTGGAVAAGSATIATGPAAVTVTQTSNRAVIDWGTFSVSQGNAVDFKQPGVTSATLNRVTGAASSQIAGQITSNGAVYLVNPNGIALTATAAVKTAGGFVASTLDIANADFMAGNLKFAGSGASAAVSNGGSITAGKGAYVALLGGSVSNSGTIAVPLGRVGLGSGESVALDLNGGNFMQVAVPTSALAGGALVDSSGKITAAGGTVLLKAASAKDWVRNVVNMSGTISADSATVSGGTVILDGEAGGTVDFAGKITARATGGTGDGGFVETSGAHVKLNGAVDTTSVGGSTGNWLIDPPDFKLAASGGDMTGAALSTQLATTSVTIQSSAGASGTNGDVLVGDVVNWSSGNTLTLSAFRNVAVNANITGSGAGAGLVLRADNTGTGTGTVTFAAGKTATLGGAGSKARIYYNPTAIGTATSFAGNVTAGTLTAYELINTAAKLQSINTNVLENYALSKNIDASSIANFVPLGTNGASGCAASGCGFQGSFDGQGFTIDKLKITRGSANYVGLFGGVGNGGVSPLTIENLNLTNVAITGGSYVGGLIGSNYSPWMGGAGATVRNVTVAGNVSVTANGQSYVGGLIGYSNGADLSNSTATVTVSSTPGSYIGGLVGYFTNGAITGAHATGNVTTTKVAGYTGSYVGGLVGYLYDGSITLSNATGALSSSTASSYQYGGLVGYASCSSACGLAITHVQASGNITVGASSQYTGGLIGYATNFSGMSDAFASGDLSVGASSTYVGGLVGYAGSLGGGIDNASSTGDVTVGIGSSLIGGLIGNGYNTNVTMSYTTGAVVAGNNANGVGGLFGTTSGGSIFSSHASGAVTVGTNSYSTGGLAGTVDAASVSDSYAEGNVGGGLGSSGIGGLVGSSTNVSYSNTSAIGTVTGSTNVGGLVGTTGGGLIEDSFATGNIFHLGSAASSFSNIGGLVGSNAASLDHVYASGTLNMGAGNIQYVGGLAGYNSGSVNDTFASGNLIGTSTTTYGGGLLGYSSGATISDSYASGNVSGGSTLGGLIGSDSSGSILESYATGVVYGTGTLGGLIGSAGSDQILKSYAAGGVTAGASANYVGGLVGYSSGAIEESHATGAVVAGNNSSNVGGLAGQINGNVAKSYATGPVSAGTSSSSVGGLIGNAYGTVTRAYAGGAVTVGTGSDGVGGLVGYASGALVDVLSLGSVMAGTVGTPGTATSIGGLVGKQYATITNAFAIGNVTAAGSGSTYVGGLVGYSYNSINTAYARGVVYTGANASQVGGLVGYEASTITRAYATGNVNGGAGSTAIGGLVGELGYSGRINQTYAVGIVTGPAGQVGGLVGQSDGSSIITSSYWNKQTSGQTSMCGIANGSGCKNSAGLTTAQMTDFSNYGTTYAGWNFAGKWSPPSQVGQAGQVQAFYPQLYAINPVLVANPDAASRLYGSPNPALTGTVIAGGPDVYVFTDGNDFLAPGALFHSSATATSGVGDYAILPNLPAMSDEGVPYRVIMPVGANLTINPAPLTVTYTSNAVSRLYGAANPALTGTTSATGLLNGDTLASLVSGTAKYNTSATAASNVGKYAVNGSGLADASANYVITFVQASTNAKALTITPAPLAIYYTSNAGTRIYGAADPTYSGTVAAIGLVNGDTLGAVTTGTAAWTTNATALSGVGTYAINGSGVTGASANYNYLYLQDSHNANQLTITPAPLTLTYTADAASRLYGAANPALSGTVAGSGFVNGDTVASATSGAGSAVFTTAATTTSNVGNYAINGSGVTSANYAITAVQAAGNATALSVTPAPLTVTYKSTAVARLYGAVNPALTGTVITTGLLNGDTLAGVTNGTAVFKTNATAASNAGKYAINGSGLTKDSANYAITFAQAGTNATALTVNKAALTLTYTADPATRPFNTANPTFTGTVAGSGFVNTDTVASLGGIMVFKSPATKSSPAGSYAINGSGLTSTNYTITVVQDAGNATALTITP